nr:hypothetical protein CFP56_54512 [Quercus suber]
MCERREIEELTGGKSLLKSGLLDDGESVFDDGRTVVPVVVDEDFAAVKHRCLEVKTIGQTAFTVVAFESAGYDGGDGVVQTKIVVFRQSTTIFYLKAGVVLMHVKEQNFHHIVFILHLHNAPQRTNKQTSGRCM